MSRRNTPARARAVAWTLRLKLTPAGKRRWHRQMRREGARIIRDELLVA